ncbi:MAG: hypothetical protein P8J50_11215 [Acidimicrobiales bacterium]|nr:hypothetical protein [Acidimicrobiales bacterium]
MKHRRLLALLLCAALLATGCGSDDTSDEGGTPPDSTDTDELTEPEVDERGPETDPDTDTDSETDPDPEPLTASDRGVTEDTITLGIAITDVEVFAPIGDMVEVYEALAAIQNEAGGVDGRQIALETQKWGIVDRTGYEAACVALTEDVETFLIIGFLIPGFSGSECYTLLNERIVINTEAIAADTLAGANGRALTVSPNQTTLVIDGLALLADELNGANVAVYSGNGEGIAAAEAALIALGANVVDVTEQVTGGADDLLAAEAELDLTAQRWIVEEVEWVINLDGAGAGSVAALQRAGRNDIAIAGWTDVAALTALGADLSLAETLIGLGRPQADQLFVDGQLGVPECLERVTAELDIEVVPFVPSGEEDRLTVISRACAAWDVFVAFAEAAGPNLTEESFLDAGAALGEFEMTGAPSGSFAADKPFVPNIDPALFVYDVATQDFVLR